MAVMDDDPRDPVPSSPPVVEADAAWGTRKALEVLAVAFVLPLTLYVGYAAGRWVGERWGDATVGGLVGAGVGALAGFWELHRLVRRLWPR
jgi:hypothetical protein